MNKNKYETLLFLLVALTALLLCIVGLAVAVKGAISVLYRPENISPTPASYLSPNVNSIANTPPDNGQWWTSTANKWNSTHVTLTYNNGLYDFIMWAPNTYLKIPKNTPYYVYFNISQIAIPSGAGTAIFMVTDIISLQSSTGPYALDKVYAIWANTTHIVAKYFTNNAQGIAYAVDKCDTQVTVINSSRFDPSKQLIIVAFLNSGTTSSNPYIYSITVIQGGKTLLTIPIRNNLGSWTEFIVVTKYQMTVADMFASYQAPDVLLQTSTTTTTTTIPTLTVYALDANTGKNVTGSVYLNGTLMGQTGKPIQLSTVNPNATQTIKVSASNYQDYTFTIRVNGNLSVYVFLTPIVQTSQQVQVTFYTYDAITGNAIQGTISSGFNTFTSGKTYNFTTGYYTFTASAQGYKSLTFSAYISSNTVIPIYLYPQSYTATNSSGSVGYKPANTTTISQPNPQTYTGEYVGFHFINPSNQSITVSVYASIKGIVDTYHVLVDTFNLPAYSDAYKSYNLRDVALKAGVINVITPNPGTYTFTIMANNARIASITGDVAYQKYVDVYVTKGSGFTAMWGSGLTGSLGSFQWGDVLAQLMPILVIALIFGVIEGVLPGKRK